MIPKQSSTTSACDVAVVNPRSVIAVMHANSSHVRKLLATVIPKVGADAAPCPHGCDHALDMAIMTANATRFVGDRVIVSQLS
jgi:hypothetical protein